MQVDIFNRNQDIIKETTEKLQNYAESKEVIQSENALFRSDLYLNNNKLDLNYKTNHYGIIAQNLLILINDLYESNKIGLERLFDAKDANLAIALTRKRELDKNQKDFDKMKQAKASR